MVKVIPNVLTICNLITGFLGILIICDQFRITKYFQLGGDKNTNTLIIAFVCVCISGIFDLFDGYIARKVGADGDLGKQLDSLADLVSFGVLPAIFLYKLLIINNLKGDIFLLVPIAIVVCSAVRLAKFNIDDSQTDVFLGIPTPASAIFITSLFFWGDIIVVYPYLLVIYGLFIAFMMVAKVPILALKSIGKSRSMTVVFISLGVFLVISFFFHGFKAIAVAMHLYIFLSFFFLFLKRVINAIILNER